MLERPDARSECGQSTNAAGFRAGRKSGGRALGGRSSSKVYRVVCKGEAERSAPKQVWILLLLIPSPLLPSA